MVLSITPKKIPKAAQMTKREDNICDQNDLGINPEWPVRKRMMKEMAIMIKTISTWTETFQAAFQVAPMPFVIGTLFMLLMWKIRMRVVQCTTMHTMCILLLFANQGFKPEECGGEDSSTASPLKTHPDLCT